MSVMADSEITYADLKKMKKPVTRVVPILMDPDIGRAYEDADLEYRMADITVKQKPEDKLALARLREAEALRDELYEAMQEATIDFVFKPVNRTVMDDIIQKNPPTSKQAKEAAAKGQELSWNPDTMPAILVSESLTSPKLTIDEVNELWAEPEWNSAEQVAMFEAAMAVNNSRTNPALKKG